MKVKVLNIWPVLAALIAPLMWAASTRTAHGEIAGESQAKSALDGYRDGARWVVFTRSGRFEQGRELLQLCAGRRSFRALVGPHAVVQLRRGLRAPRTARERLRQLRLRTVEPLSTALGIYLVDGERHEDGASLAARLSSERDVESVSPDLYTPRRRASIALPPNDPRYGGQWYLDTIDIEGAWRLSSGARDITVAVVDDGCDLRHPDLAAQLVPGRDVLDGDDDPSFAPNQPGNTHGTACAGIVAAAPTNGVGIVGTCPECTLSCVRLVNNYVDQGVPLSADIAAFEFALQSGAAVVSNSWGFAESVPVPAALAAAIERVAEQGNGGRGAVVVFAAGNENRAIADDEIAALPYVLAVGAVNRFDESAPFANYGPALDLSAPTGSLTTDISGPDGDSSGDYTNLFGGTSAACPVVAGVAALAMAAASDASAADVRRALIESARKAPFATPDASGHDEVYGYGIVDPAAALRALGVAAPDAGAATDAGEPRSTDGSAGDASGTGSSAEDASSDDEAVRDPLPHDASQPAPGENSLDAGEVTGTDAGAGPATEREPVSDDSPARVAEDDRDDPQDQVGPVHTQRRGSGCSVVAGARPDACWCGLLGLLFVRTPCRRRARCSVH
ncbi:MAG TPA: S8 family serine peptidase [Polyangiales bacterium]